MNLSSRQLFAVVVMVAVLCGGFFMLGRSTTVQPAPSPPAAVQQHANGPVLPVAEQRALIEVERERAQQLATMQPGVEQDALHGLFCYTWSSLTIRPADLATTSIAMSCPVNN